MPAQLLIEALIGLVQQAGELVLQVYERDFSVLAKADASPVTEADWRAEALITPALQVLLPGVPVLAEEATAAGLAPAAAGLGERFWLVDPLDGTREFVQRNGEFTVNVALIEQCWAWCWRPRWASSMPAQRAWAPSRNSEVIPAAGARSKPGGRQPRA
mgnify:CR=1 FL=1